MLIKKLITPCSVPSKSLLLEEGQLANTLYYIKKGCLRLFFCNEGKEITFQFFFEGDFVASFDSLYKHIPSLFSLESIEPAELLYIRRKDFFRLIKEYPSLRNRWSQTKKSSVTFLMCYRLPQRP